MKNTNHSLFWSPAVTAYGTMDPCTSVNYSYKNQYSGNENTSGSMPLYKYISGYNISHYNFEFDDSGIIDWERVD